MQSQRPIHACNKKRRIKDLREKEKLTQNFLLDELGREDLVCVGQGCWFIFMNNHG